MKENLTNPAKQFDVLDLPYAVLRCIFGYISDKDLHFNVRKVCRRHQMRGKLWRLLLVHIVVLVGDEIVVDRMRDRDQVLTFLMEWIVCSLPLSTHIRALL